MGPVVVLLSGGPGSAVVAYRSAAETQVRPLHVDYGRPSAKAERDAAAALAEALGVTLKVVDLPHVRQIADDRNAPVPRAGAERRNELGGPGDIPGLTATLLAVGAEYAAAIGAREIITGQTAAPIGAAGDALSRERTIDPQELHHAFGVLLEAALPVVRSVRLEAPLIDLQPAEWIKLGERFRVPFELTWSCHRSPPPCGTCSGCRKRAAGFAGAALSDPLLHTSSA